MSIQEQFKQREIWLDNLRIVAIICVVIIHVSRPPNDNINNIYPEIYQASLRFCVPLFVMISGAIQLNKSSSSFFFYKKKIPKILLVLLFWGSVHILFNHIFESPYNLKGYLGSFLLSSTPGSFHLWFLYLIIELYLITPLCWFILSRLSIKKVLFLSLLLVFLLFDFTPLRIIGFSETKLIVLTSFPDYLLLFIPYIPYYLLGKGIRDIKPKFNFWQILMLMFIFIISLVYSSFMSIKTNSEVFYSYTSINIYVSSVSLFCLFYQLGEVPIFGKRLNAKLATASFGIYLVHNLIRDIFLLFGINGFIVSPAMGIPIYTGVVFIISYALTILLKSNQFTKMLV